MAQYLIEKSNATGRWTGRQWWVEADSEAEALRVGQQRYPSKNTLDQFHARPLTEDEINEFYRQQFAHDMRAAENRAKGGYTGVAGYCERLKQNKLRSLDRNVENLRRAGCSTAPIERVAERIAAE